MAGGSDLFVASVPKRHHVGRIDLACLLCVFMTSSWCFHGRAPLIPTQVTLERQVWSTWLIPQNPLQLETNWTCVPAARAGLHKHTHIPGTNFNFILPLWSGGKTTSVIAQRGVIKTAGEMRLRECTTLADLPEKYSECFHFAPDWLLLMATLWKRRGGRKMNLGSAPHLILFSPSLSVRIPSKGIGLPVCTLQPVY